MAINHTGTKLKLNQPLLR